MGEQVTTRAVLEAAIWRALARAYAGHRPAAADTDTLLAAADAYAQAAYGLAAARRAAITPAHWQHPYRAPGAAACHGRVTTAQVTPDRALVSCPACLASPLYTRGP